MEGRREPLLGAEGRSQGGVGFGRLHGGGGRGGGGCLHSTERLQDVGNQGREREKGWEQRSGCPGPGEH